jgi:hypothetical protein
LVGGELRALPIAPGVQQLAQHRLDLVALDGLPIQLSHQVQNHPLENLGIVGKMLGIDGHESVTIMRTYLLSAKNKIAQLRSFYTDRR